ncbi:hypothetical protein IB257_25275 [Achromobacter sp. ACM03]|uniref:hypothetical protein n=1 Tax=Achromobacter sp. ACM03 TaxID=2769300 RepID=UPI0017823273|nr:hypothetical protein [Achromobacter sp. ACM03]MBD9433263.1 hypothetical protein [Achromobacter sp. ACM03]
MAGIGSFAGGLADGLRNGMAIGSAYNRAAEERRAREADKKIAGALAGDDTQQPAQAGLERIQVPEAVVDGAALPEMGGLQRVPLNAPVAPTAGAEPGAAAAGLADVLPGAQWGAGTAVRPGGSPLAGALEKKSTQAADFLGGGDFGQVADGLTRAYRKALELGEPGRAMELLAGRERFIGQHREQAFATAQSRYQLTGDPNSFVPFVNRFMPGGIEVTSINRRAEQAGGAPLYDFVGVDTATGKPVQQPITEHMLQSFVQSISDPKAQQAMVAQQAKLLYQAEEKRRDALLASQLRKDEEASKPRILNKDQTLYTPDGKGGMRVGAKGSEAGKPTMVTSDKDFANHVMRLFKVDSMEGLGEDERKRVGDVIAIGENINRMNAGMPGGEVLTPANLAELSQRVRAGTAEFEPVSLEDGGIGFTVRHEGARIQVPLSAVPNQVQQMVAARLEGGEPVRASQPQRAARTTAPSASGGAASRRQPAQTRDVAGANSSERDNPAGAQLDAARAQLRQAETAVRQLRTSPPGLKAGAQARAEHAAQLEQAERDVELAKVAERAAADGWARATEGSEITRAAMGRANAGGMNGSL